ncbi:quinon protein alcohol dehydrogenase-like superfamily, partial [Podospora australis]
GLFIYAATVCRFAREGGSLAGERLARLISTERLPARAGTELDRMYMTVLEYSLNTKLDPGEMARTQELFRRVAGSVVVLFDALSPASLAMLLGEPKETIASPLGSLHSLLDVPEEEGRLIRLLHPSFREFLLDPQRCAITDFYIDGKEAHKLLFECCLRIMASHLRQDMCDLRRPGTRVGDISRSQVNEKVPFAVHYACRYWVGHLERSDIDPQEHCGIADFLATRFLFWLEALALIGRLADGVAMIRILETRLHRTEKSPGLGAVVYDAKQLLLSHSSIIGEAPLQVYSSALVFSPEASIIRRLYMAQVPEWIVRAPALSEDWSGHLQTLSHPSVVRAVTVSPDGRLIVSGSDDNTVRVWDAVTGAERCVLKGHSSWVNAVAILPDGRLIVSGSRDNTVRVWDAVTDAERRVLKGHSGAVSAVAISPDGRLIVSGSDDNTVRVWDAVTGAERRVLKGNSSSVSAVAISPDGRLIVSGSRDNTVRVWDAATSAENNVLQVGAVLRYLSFSSCGKHLVTDRGVFQLPSSDCRCSRNVSATKSWITHDGKDLLYLHPDYQDSFGFLSDIILVFVGRISHALQLKLP